MFLSFDGLFALMATPLSSLPPPTTSLLACLDLVCPPKPPVPPDPVPPEPPPPPLYSSVATDTPITDLNVVGLAFASGGIRSELWFSSCGVVSLGSRATFLLRLKCLPPAPLTHLISTPSPVPCSVILSSVSCRVHVPAAALGQVLEHGLPRLYPCWARPNILSTGCSFGLFNDVGLSDP